MKLVIFDCDGTLVNSEFLCNLALEYQLSEVGIQYSSEDLLAKYRGGKLASIFSSLESELEITLPEAFESAYRLKANNLLANNANMKSIYYAPGSH